VGWISTTRVLGDIFGLSGLHTVHLIMTTTVFITWLVLIVLTGVAFWKGKIFISKEEDVLKDSLLVAAEEGKGESELEKGGSDFDHSQPAVRHH